MSDNSLVNLGELSKPVTVLIEKTSKAVGTLYEPRRIRNVAKAEAKAEKIKAETEIEITDLQMRAEQRRLEEEARNQKNMEDITAKAAPHINEDANPEAMDNDWIANFFDKCRIISDSEMQSLWARLLAGEANSPGTYSKRTVNFVSELDKKEADLFTKLCGFSWVIEGELVPLVFNCDSKIYIKHELCFGNLSHLDSIGLIHFDYAFNFVWEFLDTNVETYVVHYYETPLNLEVSSNYKKIEAGGVSLTKIGQELAPISGGKPVEGFYEYVKDQWWQYLPKSENK